MTRDGVKTINRKIESMTHMKLPAYRKVVQKFIGAINYHCDMLPRRLYLLASLTKLIL